MTHADTFVIGALVILFTWLGIMASELKWTRKALERIADAYEEVHK